jgi:hypothetical protein
LEVEREQVMGLVEVVGRFAVTPEEAGPVLAEALCLEGH